MSKYKAGDTVYVKCKILKAVDDGCYTVKDWGNPNDGSGVRHIYTNEDKMSDISADEAWEVAQKIVCDQCYGGMPDSDLNSIFGTRNTSLILADNTAEEAKAKIKAWEKANENLKVGDVVYGEDEPDALGIVVREPHANHVYILWNDGSCGDTCIDSENFRIKKTGQHIDIQGILEQIGGES